MRPALLCVLLLGCEPAEEDYGRCGGPEPVFEIDYGVGDEQLFVGIPPQGGAPYTPFVGRVTGMEPGSDGFLFTMRAEDLDTAEVLGETDVQMDWICANVGDNADWYVGAELHLRYDGWEVDALAGRTIAVTFTVQNALGKTAVDRMTGPLLTE